MTTDSLLLKLATVAIAFISLAVYIKGLHRVDFDPSAKSQRVIFAVVMSILILFSFFVCALISEDEWTHEYPLEESVDDYGCYPQMFDAFQKGQLNIDTEYDLSRLEKLENPYDPAARTALTGETHGVIWDRAYYDGKLYSYFGVAPIIYLYYPFYILTGTVLSDALASAIISALCCIVLSLLLWELCRRMTNRPPFVLMLLGAITLPSGALLWPTLTNANFYHIAVLSGILTTSLFFLLVLKAEAMNDGWKRKTLFALAGASVAAIVASRPNMVLYVLIALPLLISVIIRKPFGKKSLWLDIAAFSAPMLALGGLIMYYNYARFGSPFDFGSTYQLTLADTSTYSFSASMIIPAFYHYFAQLPETNDIFPYIHPSIVHLGQNYGVDRVVYTAPSVGAVFFPTSWGCFLFLSAMRKTNKVRLFTVLAAGVSVAAVAIFDMVYAGVHLRYAADVMFVIALLGVYLLLLTVADSKDGSGIRIGLYTAAAIIFALTLLFVIPLCLDNERDLIAVNSREFYTFLRSN